MISELVSHEIFADNLLLGKSLFFSLGLPPGWHLAPGVGRPEIVAIHERAKKRWVVTGDAWYVIYHDEKRWALELALKIRPIPDNQQDQSGESISVNRHPGRLTWKHKNRGLPWKRHTVTFMNMVFDCLKTERRIQLEFSGWCPAEGFEEIQQAVQQLGCH